MQKCDDSIKLKRKGSETVTNHMFFRLLDLEEEYISGSITHCLISALTEIYAGCIEYYDKQQDPVGLYFHEKLQALLSSKKTIEALYDASKNILASKSTQQIPSHISKVTQLQEQNSNQLDESLITSDFTVPSKQHTPEQPKTSQKQEQSCDKDQDDLAYNKRKKEKTTKMVMYMEIQQNDTKNEEDATEMLESYTKNTEISDQMIQQCLADQEETVKRRVQKRNSARPNNKTSFFD